MASYLGFKPGESRSSAHRIRPQDRGHSIVKATTTRRAENHSFTYSITCQCGKVFRSDRTFAVPYTTQIRHVNKELRHVQTT